VCYIEKIFNKLQRLRLLRQTNFVVTEQALEAFPVGREHFRVLMNKTGIDRRTILRWILNRVQTRYKRLWIGSMSIVLKFRIKNDGKCIQQPSDCQLMNKEPG
jgi:hypothetical protein